MQEIVFPKSVSMDYKLINDLLFQIGSLLPPSQNQDVCMNFHKTTWLNADLTPFLGNLILHLKKRRYDVYATSFGSENVNRVLSKNGFLKKHGIGNQITDIFDTTIGYNIFKSEEFIDIDNYLDNEVFSKIHQLINPDEISIIRDSVYEIFHNVKDHSRSDLVIVCGQHYPAQKLVSLTLSDVGISIPTKVIETYPQTIHLPESQLIDWATRKGNSTKKMVSSGLGLFEIKENLTGIGALKIISDKGYWSIDSNDGVTMEQLVNSYPGTLIRLTLFLPGNKKRVQKSNFQDSNDSSLVF